MLKSRLIALLFAILCASASVAQSPADARITGNSYVNNYFHLTYTWPAILNPQPLPKTDLKAANSYEFLLFSAKQDTQPYGIALVAEKLNAAGPHSASVKSAADLLDRMQHSLRPGPVLSNIARSQKKSASGVVFEVLDYLQNGKPSSVLATQSGQYVLLFKCNAQNAADMASFQKSVLAARIAH